MKLSIHKIEGETYSHSLSVLPFIFKVEFDVDTIIGDDLRANLYTLINSNDEIVQTGGSVCITAIRSEEELVGPGKSKYLHSKCLG